MRLLRGRENDADGAIKLIWASLGIMISISSFIGKTLSVITGLRVELIWKVERLRVPHIMQSESLKLSNPHSWHSHSFAGVFPFDNMLFLLLLRLISMEGKSCAFRFKHLVLTVLRTYLSTKEVKSRKSFCDCRCCGDIYICQNEIDKLNSNTQISPHWLEQE